MTCSSCSDPRIPRAPPINLNHPSNMSSSGASIQNGRILPRRRRRFFSMELYHFSRLIQHPTQITFREVCVLAWALYALYCFYLKGSVMWDLTVSRPVETICRGKSFVKCGWDMVWMALYVQLGAWLGQVVPWGIVCTAVVFLGEEVLRQYR